MTVSSLLTVEFGTWSNWLLYNLSCCPALREVKQANGHYLLPLLFVLADQEQDLS